SVAAGVRRRTRLKTANPVRFVTPAATAKRTVKPTTLPCSSPTSARKEPALPASVAVEAAEKHPVRRKPAEARYVGNFSFTARQLFGATARGNCAEWFAGAAVHYTHTARTAINKALAALNLRAGDEILVPAYNCGSELDVLLQAGLRVRLYRITSTAELDAD